MLTYEEIKAGEKKMREKRANALKEIGEVLDKYYSSNEQLVIEIADVLETVGKLKLPGYHVMVIIKNIST